MIKCPACFCFANTGRRYRRACTLFERLIVFIKLQLRNVYNVAPDVPPAYRRGGSMRDFRWRVIISHRNPGGAEAPLAPLQAAHRTDQASLSVLCYALNKKLSTESILSLNNWYPVGESNPRCHRERVES